MQLPLASGTGEKVFRLGAGGSILVPYSGEALRISLSVFELTFPALYSVKKTTGMPSVKEKARPLQG